LWIFACAAMLALVVPGPSLAAARSVYLNESGHLYSTSGHGISPTRVSADVHINEQGSVSGTIHGPVYIHVHVSSLHSFVAEVNVYTRGGSLTGYGSAGFRLAGGYAQFSGSLSITRGTGSYSHARAHNLRFTGSIQGSNDAVTVRLSGTMYY
jgi:hypothetical protein